MQNNDIFDFELEYEMIPVERGDDSEYLSDDVSCELNFDLHDDEPEFHSTSNENSNGHGNGHETKLKPNKTKLFKKYLTRKYFRDRTECINIFTII